MHLSGLQIRHFRNLAEQQFDLPAEGVAIVGENAQGKTNLLEAIYYLETFRSFRGSRDDRLVAFGEEAFRVVGSLRGGEEKGEVEVAAAFQIRGKRKKVTLDGQEPERLGDGLGRLAAVIFSPADVALVRDGPGARRRFLDIVLSLNVPGYLQALQQFRQTLTQRNAALKNGQQPASIEAWDAGLIEHRGDLLGCAPEPPYNKPVLGRLPDWENGYVATNFGGLGICLSPGVGQIMADLISDGEVPFRARQLMEQLSPARL